jgi:hypothetical protein
MWVNVLHLHTEILFTLLVVCALLLADSVRRRPLPALLAGLGFVLGLATLARPNGLFVAAAIGLWLAVTGVRTRGWRGLAPAALTGVATLTVVAPWIVWIHQEVGVVAPVTTQGGPVLAGYYSPRLLDWRGTHYWGAWDVSRVGEILHASPDEATYYRNGQEAGLRFVRERPGDSAGLVVMRVARYFDLYWQQEGRIPLQWFPSEWKGVNIACTVGWWIAAALALLGLSRLRARNGGTLAPLLPGLLVFAALAGSAILLGATPRLRAPSEPVVVVLAAAALALRAPLRSEAPSSRRVPAAGLPDGSGTAPG